MADADDPIDRTIVTFVGVADPADPEEALDVLKHVDDYDVPASFGRRITNVADLDPDLVETGQVMFADHVPTEFDATVEEPNISYTTVEDGRIRVQFRADGDHLEHLAAFVEHVLEVTGLTVGTYGVVFEVDFDVTDHVGMWDLEGIGEYELDVKVHPDGGQSAVRVTFDPAGRTALTDSADPLLEGAEAATRAVTDRLP